MHLRSSSACGFFWGSVPVRVVGNECDSYRNSVFCSSAVAVVTTAIIATAGVMLAAFVLGVFRRANFGYTHV
jgi:hypothetical protein